MDLTFPYLKQEGLKKVGFSGQRPAGLRAHALSPFDNYYCLCYRMNRHLS